MIQSYLFLLGNIFSYLPSIQGVGLGTTGKQSAGLILPPFSTNYNLGNSNDPLVGLLFSEKTVKNGPFK